jgi:predicted nucleic acid-binding protein
LIGKRLSVIEKYISDDLLAIVVTNQLIKEIVEVTNRERLKKYFPAKHCEDVFDIPILKNFMGRR